MYKYKATVIRVVDGDTLEADIRLGFDVTKRETVRFAEIDAYETRLGKNTTEEEKELGLKGKEFLKSLLEGKEVILETFKDKGKYGRYIAKVYFNEQNINELMIKEGYAIFKRY